jgi:mannan endo-1,4-beta-mannosidase
VASVNKTYFAGEYDWVGQKSDGTVNGDSLAAWYDVIQKSQGAIGSAFWSLFGHNVPDCSVSHSVCATKYRRTQLTGVDLLGLREPY